MRGARALPGAVLWVLASLLGLVGILLCATIVLLPVGIPLLKLACRLFGRAVQLMIPRALAHPVDELEKATDKKSAKARSTASDASRYAAKKGRKLSGATSDAVSGAAAKGRKAARKRVKSLT